MLSRQVPKPFPYFFHIFGKAFPLLFFNIHRRAVKHLRDPAGNAGQCVCVSSERNRCADDILKPVPLVIDKSQKKQDVVSCLTAIRCLLNSFFLFLPVF